MNRSASCLKNNAFSVRKNDIELALVLYKELTFLIEDLVHFYFLLECGSIELMLSSGFGH